MQTPNDMRAFHEQADARSRSRGANPSEAQRREDARRLHAAQQAELRGARERLTNEFERGYVSLKRWLKAERGLIRIKLFDHGLRLVGYAALALPALALSVVASLLALASVRRGLQEWTDGAWWADFALAIAVLSLLPLFAMIVRGRVHRSALRDVRRALGEEPTEPRAPQAFAHPESRP